jgi:plasmid stabilization system protein ParE
VPRLVYRAAALRDLARIAAYIESQSGSRDVAEAFIEKLTDYCEHLASLPGMRGRPRQELRQGYRSITYGSYVIFLRYADDEGQRSHLYVCNVIQGNRDLDAYFAGHRDEDA